MIKNAIALSFALAALASPARAQSAEDFYRGKTVTILVGFTAGGGYDLYARLLGRHISRHIPGNPAVVVQNMPGAGSMRSANYLFNVAPKDGTAIGMFGRGIAIEPLIGSSPAQFEAVPEKMMNHVHAPALAMLKHDDGHTGRRHP